MKVAVAIVLSLTAFAAPAAAQAPALWSIRDGDTTIYMVGSVHALDAGPAWLKGDIAAAFDASEEIVLEAVVTDMTATSQRAEQLAKSDVPLRSRLSKRSAARLEAALGKMGRQKADLDHYAPWYANTMLSAEALWDTDYDANLSVEAVLQARARESGKSVIGFESVDDQLSMIASIPVGAQLRQLEQTLRDPAAVRSTTEDLVRCWRVGDLECISEGTDRDLGSIPEVRETLLTRRNEQWAAWIADRMKRPGVVLVAVGVGHFVGRGSLIERLGTLGHDVKRIGGRPSS